MGLKSIVKEGIERLTGARVIRTLPHGTDFFTDANTRLSATPIATIFDVGANIGQSAQDYRRAYPKADLFCFEPVQATFDGLVLSLQNVTRAKCFKLAFGRSAGVGEIFVGSHSDSASLATRPKDATRVESVSIATIDGFCTDHHIAHIGLLKIDTEGADLDVLHGAEEMIRQQEIDIVQVEAGMLPGAGLHVPLEAFTTHMFDRNYFLFGIYEQYLRWSTREPILRRVNPVFISRHVVDANALR